MNINSVFIRKGNENYNVVLEYLDEETGKSKKRSQGSLKKKKDAEKLLIEIKSSINNNKFQVPTSKTFVDRCYEYYNNTAKDFSPTTLKRANAVIKNYVTPFLEIKS